MMMDHLSPKQKQIWLRLGKKVLAWTLVLAATIFIIMIFVNYTVSKHYAQEELIIAQNKIRQSIDTNYYDWDHATLASHAPHLAAAMEATWRDAGQIWPHLSNDFHYLPIILMSAGGHQAFLFSNTDEPLELPDFARENKLTNLAVGWHQLKNLTDFPNQTIILRILDHDHFSKFQNQNLEWLSAPLPGALFAEMASEVFKFVTDFDQKDSEEVVISDEIYLQRFEVLAALQAALLENDLTRRDNYLDRAAYFYTLSQESNATAAAQLENLDYAVGANAYFAWSMRLRASHHLYDPDSNLDGFIAKVARNNFTIEKAIANFSSGTQAQWLGATSGLLLDRLSVTNWKQEVTESEISPLQILLAGRLNTQDYAPNNRVEKIFKEQNINQETAYENSSP